MKQITCPATGQVEVVEVPVPEIGHGDVLVRLTLCGICGTDLMKVYSPDVAKPVQLGHEVVGTIAAVGRDVHKVRVGQRVAVAHHVPDYSTHYARRGSAPMDALFKRSNIDPGGFAEYIRVPALHVQHTLELVPDDMSNLRAVFMEPLACCLRACNRMPVIEGDTTLLIGAGAVGLLFVPLLRDRSATVLAVDVRQERLDTVQAWGAAAGFLTGRDDAVTGVRSYTEGRGADQVILTVVNPATLALAVESVRDGGVLVLFGVKPDAQIAVDLWQLWRREINVISSYSSTPDLLPRALAILKRREYALEATVSHLLPLEQAALGFQLIHDGQASKVVIGSG